MNLNTNLILLISIIQAITAATLYPQPWNQILPIVWIITGLTSKGINLIRSIPNIGLPSPKYPSVVPKPITPEEMITKIEERTSAAVSAGLQSIQQSLPPIADSNIESNIKNANTLGEFVQAIQPLEKTDLEAYKNLIHRANKLYKNTQGELDAEIQNVGLDQHLKGKKYYKATVQQEFRRLIMGFGEKLYTLRRLFNPKH